MWTPAALASEARPYAGEVWRVVETQYKAATMAITDTLEEQEILERILDRSKPKFPPDCAGLDYLLATPFRYWPYPYGSRFRRADQPDGAFYAAEHVETAVAETSFYSLLFFAESPEATLPARPVEHTAFSVPCRTAKHIDLTKRPLVKDRAVWTHPTNYAPCHDLADSARDAAVAAIRYESVRDPERRANIAILSPKAFAAKRPKALQTWRVFIRRHAVQAWCEAPRRVMEFPIAAFAADPRIKRIADDGET